MNPELISHIKTFSEELFLKVQTYREHIHKNPELSYHEVETMNFVSAQLTKLGISHEKNIGGTGVVGIIENNHPQGMKCVALRSDLDALPIQEENEVAYKSDVAGVMHACGHDVHTSILLGTAEILCKMKEHLPQPVKLIFQPGEEKNPGGATYMIRDGVLKSPEVEKIFALHVFPEMNVGEVGFRSGKYMASCDEIYLTINGKGGHAATPHLCIDPIIIGSRLILELQQIISKKCDDKIPFVLSFGHFEAIGATNVIPEKASLKGTFRTIDEKWREEALAEIRYHIESIVTAHGGTVDLEISRGYPCVINDERITNQLVKKAESILGKNYVHELPIRLTSEDFAFYSQKVPACFFRLGVRNEEKGITHNVHHPKFDIDPEALKIGMQVMAAACF
ncbi:MAG: amidohydrolase [Bacteroidetes bacterium]|nr:amidohydrolase [Bacteroidota bacterium]